MHYAPKKDNCSTLKPEGFLLVDNGGSFYDGTTDITRTFVLGKISDEMKKDFTLVLKSHIAIAEATFLYGSTGANLDTIARIPMWEEGLDYKCGTGHGVGFFLNVHEGPQYLSPKAYKTVFEVGMIVTNEPGVYKENKYGIRTENTMKVVESFENEFGKFLKFEIFSYCPIDLASIDKELLTEKEINWLNNYHKKVFEKLSPSLNEYEILMLKDMTKEL